MTAIVFVETGLLIGFFLPGDSLLVTAGLFAARGDLELVPMIVVLSIAAIVGDTVGYNIGARAGPKLFTRPNFFTVQPQASDHYQGILRMPRTVHDRDRAIYLDT